MLRHRRVPSAAARRGAIIFALAGLSLVGMNLSPAHAALGGGATGGNGSQTHAGVLSGGCAEYRSFDGATAFSGGSFTSPSFTAVSTDVAVSAGPSVGVIYRAGPLGTYAVSDLTCSGSVVANPGFTVSVVAVAANGNRMECDNPDPTDGSFKRGDGTTAGALDETFVFADSSCAVILPDNTQSGTTQTGTITLTVKVVSPCLAPIASTMCAYQLNSATLSFS